MNLFVSDHLFLNTVETNPIE